MLSLTHAKLLLPKWVVNPLKFIKQPLPPNVDYVNVVNQQRAAAGVLWALLCLRGFFAKSAPCCKVFVSVFKVWGISTFDSVFFVILSLRPLDVEFMKRLSKVVNIVPVIAKADTLTLEERDFFKKKASCSLSP